MSKKNRNHQQDQGGNAPKQQSQSSHQKSDQAGGKCHTDNGNQEQQAGQAQQHAKQKADHVSPDRTTEKFPPVTDRDGVTRGAARGDDGVMSTPPKPL